MYSAGGEENFLTLALQENYIPPTHRKNDTYLRDLASAVEGGLFSGLLYLGVGYISEF